MATSRLKRNSLALVALTTLVGGFEGLREYAYRDPVGIPTICFGETRGVYMGEHKTAEECKAMLGNRLLEFASGVDKCLTYPVSDKTYEAFVSFAYNVGTSAFCRSTLLKRANAGDVRGACDELLRWNTAAGIVLPGLDARRRTERQLCIEGVQS
jgi:lysozyme